jgi:hypothetical protein
LDWITPAVAIIVGTVKFDMKTIYVLILSWATLIVAYDFAAMETLILIFLEEQFGRA